MKPEVISQAANGQDLFFCILSAEGIGLTLRPTCGYAGMELEARTCFAGGQGFGFEAGDRLPQASDDDKLHRPR